MIDVKIKLISPHTQVPTRGSDGAAGYDVYSAYDHEVLIPPHESAMFDLGFSVAIEPGYYMAIVPRSGMAAKRHLRPSNTPGTVDEDYRGQVMVSLFNDSNSIQTVAPFERIAQIIFKKYEEASFDVVDSLDETERGEGGFGSTGTH